MTDEVAAFGAWLGAGRRSAGLSQEELAQRAGLSVRAISNLERGRTRLPHPDSVLRLADALRLGDEERVRFIAAAGRRLRGSAGPVGPPARIEGGPLVPRQLPAPPRHFTGRADELARMTGMLSEAAGAVPVLVVHGMAGVGKTALAVHWAGQVADRFPDGQLYLNLRGFDPTGTAMTAADAMRRLLDALAVPAQRIPADLDAQAALYRTLLTGRRMLVVLDNSRDAEQVRPLLPGGRGCAVVVTSRNQLASLVAAEDAHPVSLDLLAGDEAGQLLAHRLGTGRADTEPDAVATIVERCGRLPLALAIVAARAAIHPDRPLAALARELTETGAGLDPLSAGDPAADVRAAFSWSYHALRDDAARIFRLLGLHPGPDISLAAAASLAGLPARRTRTVLAELTRANLLIEHVPGRYTLHDLLRAYAADLAHTCDAQAERTAATQRVLDHYLHTARTADVILAPSVDQPRLPAPAAGVSPEQPADAREAMAWYVAEHADLLAAIDHAAAAGFTEHAWYLSLTTWLFFYRQGHWRDWAETGYTALAVARRLGNPVREARAHRAIGRAYAELGRLDDAYAELQCALELYRRNGRRVGQAHTHYNLAFLLDTQGYPARALEHARQSLDLFRAAGHRFGQPQALTMIGWLYAQLGDYEQAVVSCQESLDLERGHNDPIGQAGALGSLGHAYDRLGRYDLAVTCFQQAVDLDRQAGARAPAADNLTRLGDVFDATGRPEAARDAWQQALDTFEDLGHPDADAVRVKLQKLDGTA
jgi:tetratricopeptide (TPR) repeat protein/DNA-binding XRE family transcriptional regulator